MNELIETVVIILAIGLGYFLGKYNLFRKQNRQLKLLKYKLSKEELELFDKNLRLLKKESLVEYCCKEHRQNYSFMVLVQCAFSFHETEQGKEYWTKIANR